MYRVVGCRECGALWVVADRPETTSCPRCRTRHRFDALQAFAETEDEAAARAARTALLAERAGHPDAADELGAVTAGQLESVGVDDDEYLAASGLDPEAVAEAGERAAAGPARSPNRREIVLGALADLERPSEAAVIAYAADRGVPESVVPPLLEKLVRAGVVTESDGRYRRL